MSPPLNLPDTFLHLDGETEVREVPVGPGFWSTLGGRADLQGGRLVMQLPLGGDWTTWEMHPAGEEVVVLLSGAADMLFETPSGTERVPLRGQQAVVVPRGVWHTVDVSEPGAALFITHGRGTQHKAR